MGRRSSTTRRAVSFCGGRAAGMGGRREEEVTSELRQKIESTEPALRVEFLGILSDLIGDLASSPSPVEIRLFSEDRVALHRTATRIAESIGKVKGVVEVFNGIVVSG